MNKQAKIQRGETTDYLEEHFESHKILPLGLQGLFSHEFLHVYLGKLSILGFSAVFFSRDNEEQI